MPKERYGPFKGKTYGLFGETEETEGYYRTIKRVANLLREQYPDEKKLLTHVRKLDEKKSAKKMKDEHGSFIENLLRETLSEYTAGVAEHLRTLPLRKKADEILNTRERQYHLYMLEIELTNRVYKETFKRSEYKFALLAHCLRDFRPKCESVAGDVDFICEHCTKECFINVGSRLLEKYGIHPYISVEMDQESLFRELKKAHPSIGALGVACVPELVRGMRLCVRLGISPIGISLDANRCARWMMKAQETSFSMTELEALLK